MALPEFKLTVRNYRCFDGPPLVLDFAPGRVALVGPNNAGKSAVLRCIYDMRAVFREIASEKAGVFFSTPTPPPDWRDGLSKGRDQLVVELTVGPEALTFVLPREGLPKYVWRHPSGTLQREDFQQRRVELGPAGVVVAGERIIGDLSALAEAAEVLAGARYFGAFRNTLNAGSGQHIDATIGTSFIGAWADLKTGRGPGRESNENARALERRIARIFSFEDLQVNATVDRQHLQVFVDDQSFDLNEIGSGIAQFVVTAGNAIMNAPTLLLLDEPEANLHPRLQIAFVELLSEYASYGLIFTTHSLGLARTCASRVFSVQRDSRKPAVLRGFDNDRNAGELLGEMSFALYQELGADALLLVEGPTDVPVFRHFLRLLRLDHLAVIMPMGGGSWLGRNARSQLGEAKRITKKVFAVIDSERDSADAPLESRREDFLRAAEQEGIAAIALSRRCTESYLVEGRGEDGQVVAKYGPFDKPSQHAKWTNGRIAEQMKLNDLDGTDLHEFLLRMQAQIAPKPA